MFKGALFLEKQLEAAPLAMTQTKWPPRYSGRLSQLRNNFLSRNALTSLQDHRAYPKNPLYDRP